MKTLVSCRPATLWLQDICFCLLILQLSENTVLSWRQFCYFHIYLHALPCFSHHSISAEGQSAARYRQTSPCHTDISQSTRCCCCRSSKTKSKIHTSYQASHLLQSSTPVKTWIRLAWVCLQEICVRLCLCAAWKLNIHPCKYCQNANMTFTWRLLSATSALTEQILREESHQETQDSISIRPVLVISRLSAAAGRKGGSLNKTVNRTICVFLKEALHSERQRRVTSMVHSHALVIAENYLKNRVWAMLQGDRQILRSSMILYGKCASKPAA